ncbi:MAG: surfeit locus 1 family protein [Lentisphaeria bacterium]|jgi:surfeit locus 1 family protein
MSTRPKLKVEFNWKLTTFVVLLLPALLFLGTWQLDRADQKRQLMQQWSEQQAMVAIKFDNVAERKLGDFRRVLIRGEFISQPYWLKENQLVQGQLGYHVIMPFKEERGLVIAVDRGWVAGSPLRDFVPEFATPVAQVVISGALVVPSDSKLIREADVSPKVWPHKILEVDLPVMSKQSDMDLFPRLLRIDADSPGALDVYWRPINMSPAKHLGYAVQWFAMALVLAMLYIFASSNLAQWLNPKSNDE